MTNTEKIRAEIEQRMKLYKGLTEYTIDINRIDELEGLLAFVDSLPEEKPMEDIATSAANAWCRCFKCDRVINDTMMKCDKPKVTCLKWYDAYKGAMIALEKLMED